LKRPGCHLRMELIKRRASRVQESHRRQDKPRRPYCSRRGPDCARGSTGHRLYSVARTKFRGGIFRVPVALRIVDHKHFVRLWIKTRHSPEAFSQQPRPVACTNNDSYSQSCFLAFDDPGASGAAQSCLQSSDLGLASGTVIGLFDAAAIRINMRNRKNSFFFLLSQTIRSLQAKTFHRRYPCFLV